MDEIADLADRMAAMSEFEFEIEWGVAHHGRAGRAAGPPCAADRPRRGARREDPGGQRILIALAILVVKSDAPLGMTLGEALTAGYVGVMDVVETIRSDPLAPGT